jgi:hypothetical protein
MSGDPFAEDAQAYAALAQEIATDYPAEGEAGSADPVMDMWGGNLEQPPLDQQQVDQGYRQPQSLNSGYRDVNDDPIGHFEDRMAFMENAMGAYSTGEQFWRAVDKSEAEARAQYSDYNEAVEHLERGRWAELERAFPDAVLRQQGYANPAAVRMEMLNRDRMAVAQHALRMGQPPAKLYYEIALQKGFQSTRGPSRDETKQLLQLADRDPETFDRAWDALARKGYL